MVSGELILGIILGLVLAGTGLVYRHLWVTRPILAPDPKLPGRRVRDVNHLPYRDENGWRHHHG